MLGGKHFRSQILSQNEQFKKTSYCKLNNIIIMSE